MKEKRRKILGKAALLLALSTLLLAIPFGFQAAADAETVKPIFSPALEILSEKLSMTKSGILGHELCFSEADFDRALGYECYSVTLLSLPDEATGTLRLFDEPVKTGQVISRSDLSDLRFESACTVPTSASFTYGAVGTGSQYEIECQIYLLETLNFAPVGPTNAEDDAVVETFSGISCFGAFEGEDPEGDALHFEIARYPRKGILFTDGEGGYRYLPTGGFTGKDSFSYVCVDRYGNRSDEIEVGVRVSGISSGVLYSDLQNHPAGVAATVLAEKNIMTGGTVGGRYIFDPEESITREEFAAVLAQTLGVSPKKTDRAAFAGDDGSAPLTADGVLEYLSTNLPENGGPLDPDAPITVAEAALLLTAAAGLPDDAPVAAMQSLHIPTETLTAPLTRGETAISVCALLRYLEE